MLQDPGPSQNLGFGVNSRRDLPKNNTSPGADPGGSFIEKSLHEHPFLKFAAASAATVVGMHVAGSLIKKGGAKGLRLAAKSVESSNSTILKDAFTTLGHEMRSVSRTLDEWEGVYRAADGTRIPSNFVYSPAERKLMDRGGDPVAAWSLRQELQQRMVRQARRLPYELPAAYMVQRFPGVGTDDMFGYGDERDKPNWYNPLDVVGDFAQQSVKNLAGFLLPIEMGGAVAKSGWQRILQHADGAASPYVKNMGVNLDLSLKLVGHSAGDILHDMVRFSNKSTAAFGSGIGEAVRHNKSLVEVLHDMRTGTRAKGTRAWVASQFEGSLLDNKLVDIVQPAGAAKNFARGFKKVWNPIEHGGALNRDSFDFGQANLAAKNAGQTHFNFHGFKGIEVDVKRAEKAANRNSVIHQIAYSITGQIGKKGGLLPDIGDLRNTPFYERQMTNMYKEHLIEAMSELDGMEYDQVKKVVQALTVKRRPGADLLSGVPMANRFEFGDVPQTVGGYKEALGEALEQHVPGHGKRVVNELFKPTGVLDRVDVNFARNIQQIESRVQDQWNSAFSQVVLPFTRRKLGDAIIPNEAFTDLHNPEVQDFLIRNTANRINKLARAQGTVAGGGDAIPLMTERALGRIQRTSAEIGEDIRKYGFDPTVPEQMRSFLISQKVIAKEGTDRGFNAFGLRKMSVGDALDKGYFDDDIAPTIKRLYGEMMGGTNELGSAAFRRIPVGSVWETTSGKVVDFSPLTSGFRRVMDSLGENFQVPFVHMGLNTFGADAERMLAETPILKFSAGLDAQPFTGVKDKTDLWVFAKEGRSKGRLSRVYGSYQTEQLAGTYRNTPTDPYSMLGRHVRMAIGDHGRKPDVERRGWKKLFSVDENQPDSIRQKVQRIKGGRTWQGVIKGEPSEDLFNPSVLARKLLDDTPEGKDALRKLIQDRPNDVASAFEELERQMRLYGIRDKALDGLLAAEGVDGKLFKVGDTKISDIAGRADALDAAAIKQRDISRVADDETRRKMQQAYDMFIGKHVDPARSQARYFESKSSSQALRRRGVFRRLEEYKSDLLRYNAIEKGLRNGGDFSQVAAEMFDDINKAKIAGTITRAEETEARAAIFSMQISFDTINQFKVGRVRQDRILDAVRSANAVSNNQTKEVLRDIAESNLETGLLPGVKGFFKRRVGSSNYRYPGMEYNPFGGAQDSVFVPTFGTTWNRSKLKATGSVLGTNTWSDPESFSGASIPLAHGFQRLNGFLSTVGMSLDETDFRGPLDFYARGLVGKRVLPLVAGATAFVTADRTLGGLVNGRDQNGDRNYSPLILGGVGTIAKETSVAAAALPGGQTMTQKRQELEQGEVAIRKGRWWPLGNTPWKGGQIQYYRPSWYRRLKAGHMYTDDTYGSPMERFAYGYDFSPLRPFDPYHYEKKHLNTRPYPVTGDYFTGPWGPLTGVLNSTVGKIMKPTRKMHEKELEFKLSQYQQVGMHGVAAPPGQVDYNGAIGVGSGLAPASPIYTGSSVGGSGFAGGRGRGGGVGSGAGASFGPSMGATTGSGVGIATITALNRQIEQDGEYGGTNSQYGVTPTTAGYRPRVIYGGEPINPGGALYQASDIGYKMQELMGIYGFTFGAVRDSLGLGTQDMSPKRPVLGSPNKAYGSSRSFWDLGLGGLGDMPTPLEGDYANIEFSEFMRRFLTRERSDVNYINPISNDMGLLYPWLPGGEYFQNFKEGDPYTQVPMGEARLPGKGYEKYNNLHSDMTGRYGILDQFKILGDVAPYSEQYKQLEKVVDGYTTSREDQRMVDTVRYQVSQKMRKHEFQPYEYNDVDYKTTRGTITRQIDPGVFEVSGLDSPVRLAGVMPDRSDRTMELLNSLVGKDVSVTVDENRPGYNGSIQPRDAMIKYGGTNINKAVLETGGFELDNGEGLVNADQSAGVRKIKAAFEHVAHRDTYFNTKFMPNRTATEEWERQNVYGSTFPQWQNPIQNFVMPSIYKSTNRGPIISAVALGALGSLFGATKPAKVVGSLIGSAVGFGAGMLRNAEEFDTGQRFMPKRRRQELATEEYIDILTYVRSMKLRNEAEASGDQEAASQYLGQAQRTMYGADLHGDVRNMIAAVPDRKRPYFQEMLNAPKKDRHRILSTAGRLERRLLESAWGMDVEQRPDLGEYFSEHELPDESWGGWSPDVDMDGVKIKVAQSLGLDVSQMGYYPQQVAEANAINMPYPDFKSSGMSHQQTQQLLQGYLYKRGLNGNVRAVPNGTGSNQLVLNAGVR